MSQSFQFHIGGQEAGLRVDEFLASRFGSLSRMRIASLISVGACLVNQKTAQAGWRVSTGDIIELAMDEGAPTAMDPEPVALEIIYEDSHIVVVVKPAGLLVHPTKSAKHGTLANALAYHLNKDFYDSSEPEPPNSDPGPHGPDDQLARPAALRCENSDADFDSESSRHEVRAPNARLRTALHGVAHSLVRPGIVHRLDRATSGLMVIAKTPRALSTLSRHFNRRLVKKRYLALVEGVLDKDEGTIKAPIGRDPDSHPHWRVTQSGKEAESRFFVRERFDRATLLELEPVTGRTNQLRIHCAYSGYPIIGDELYYDSGLRIADCGLRDTPTFMKAQTDSLTIEITQSAIPQRLCLHAWQLAFHHPANGEWLEFTSPLPQDFAFFIERLNHKEKS
jgi:23S rRNA pseudouridine1911/1915/1917 synthase